MKQFPDDVVVRKTFHFEELAEALTESTPVVHLSRILGYARGSGRANRTNAIPLVKTVKTDRHRKLKLHISDYVLENVPGYGLRICGAGKM